MPTLSDENYMLLTTFRRSGAPVATPVWVAGLDDGRLGFMTSSSTGKVKRLAHTERVTVQACNGRGAVKAGSTPISGTARVVRGTEMEDVRVRIQRKYRLGVRVMGVVRAAARLVGRTWPDNDCAVVVTPALD